VAYSLPVFCKGFTRRGGWAHFSELIGTWLYELTITSENANQFKVAGTRSLLPMPPDLHREHAAKTTSGDHRGLRRRTAFLHR
jgi:hypothetical protein